MEQQNVYLPWQGIQNGNQKHVLHQILTYQGTRTPKSLWMRETNPKFSSESTMQIKQDAR